MPYTIYDNNQCGQILVGSLPERPYPTGAGLQNQLPIVSLHNPFGIHDLITNSSGDYENYSLMSLDGLLRPISMNGLDNFPQYSAFTTGCYKQNSKSAQTPLYTTALGNTEIYNLPINRDYLNPLTNPNGYSFSTRHETSSTTGHDIDLIGHPIGSLASGYSIVTSVGDGEGNESYSNDYKFLSLRGPLLVAGWGYDTNGKPIPNEADTYSNATGGVFTSTNLTNRFMPGFLQKSAAWPVAPIDLRFDRNRGVWTVPQNKMVVATATGDMAAGSTGRFKVTGTFYDEDGTLLNDAYIPVSLDFGVGVSSGQKVLNYFDTDACLYYPIIGGSSNDIFPFKLSGCFNYSDGSGTGIPLTGCDLLPDEANAFVLYAGIRNEWGNIKPEWIAGGIYGFAQKVMTEGCEKNYIVYMERPSRFIEFTTTTEFVDGEADATVEYDWMGRTIPTTVKVRLPSHYGTGCYENYGYRGIGVWDEYWSDCTGTPYNGLYYNIVDLDNKPNHVNITRVTGCFDAANATGSVTSYNSIVLGPGMRLGYSNCDMYLDANINLSKDNTCVTGGGTFASTGVSSITLGKGLNATLTGCNATIGAGITVGTGAYINSIGLGAGLTGTVGSCGEITLDLDPVDAFTNRWCLYEVYCESGNIYGRYFQYQFDSYGRVTGTITGVPS